MASIATPTEASVASMSNWQVPAYEPPIWLGRTRDACVIIPVINEGGRIRSLLDHMKAASIGAIADILIVDGGSTDGSLDAGILLPRDVRGLLVKTGPGRLSGQLRCAYAFALQQGYRHVVTIDGNDKDDPSAIPSFLKALEEGYSFVQASRFVPGGVAENTPWIRTLAIRLIHAPVLSFASGFRWTDTTQGFRAYQAALLADPAIAIFRDVFDGYELLAYLSYRAPRLGYRCIELGTTRRYPSDGHVPTKIKGLRGNLTLLQTLFKACTGGFDPRST
jgi:glycosyltransferase involved in cell wall biosynthesis